MEEDKFYPVRFFGARILLTAFGIVGPGVAGWACAYEAWWLLHITIGPWMPLLMLFAAVSCAFVILYVLWNGFIVPVLDRKAQQAIADLQLAIDLANADK